ncbi:putative transcriptional regulator [Roseivirga pacifica]|uniref:Predicted transcriptional regulator n=1 Tax=Roseivirga pacifica TaxID=1267423 RepID=A0A1I0QTT4_9BACT|nr:BlaI/MecI/CopY family transcriptional regulator [Roseivirga pacifica]MCO6357179.1 BlaI/MecI/CopY family transcriptional regulator [Roseivirga pacifica]MCO6368107.1 BlaI/MecI/CopY family transcriptional regulator [Roseivirga pacifica]MCO6369411.1 BlaI/MecI/CopY family transcriptional regulator [Roseivirga pacifica]MCO6373265.1 BlaI/MecI/CopY family transcriptional regulator [Roseivirga pacifica]MCO6377478.1 BlaI/MecI/CopY family transcriptional regulator [Roseivirga pacifica]
MNLPKSEEQLMLVLWKLKKAFMKDIVEAYPEPKPANTTIATLLKRLQDKKAVGFTKYGSVREYHPLIAKDDYFSSQMSGAIKNFFNDSVAQFASFFTSKDNLTDEQLEELRKIVDEQIKARKK